MSKTGNQRNTTTNTKTNITTHTAKPTRWKTRLGALALAAGLVTPGVVMAHRRPHHPPKAAIEACVDLAEGDACQVTLPDHVADRIGVDVLDGTCQNRPPSASPPTPPATPSATPSE